MQTFNYILKIDDDENSLNISNGISIADLGNLLTSLYAAVELHKDDKLILTAISNGSYSIQLSTDSLHIYQALKLVHSNILKENFNDLSIGERKYIRTLKSILGDKRYLEVYDAQNESSDLIRTVNLPKSPEYYYETEEVYGIISQIGARDLDSQSIIRLSGKNYKIKVTPHQDEELKKYYKGNKILLTLKIRRSLKDNNPIDAELLSWETLNGESFIHNVQGLRDSYDDQLFKDIGDSADAVRKIRNR